MVYHVPVLLKQSVDALRIKPDGIYVDVTFGGGGHSREILSRLGPNGRLIAFDRDLDAFVNKPDDNRLLLTHGNFRFINNYLRYYGIDRVDGIIADLGVSSHHFDTAERGFTFQHEALLDMRMNTAGGITAMRVVNFYDQDRLTEMFRSYGELDNARRLSQFICKARESAVLKTNNDLVEAVKPCLPKYGENKILAKIFQAIRIEINGELTALKSLLSQSVKTVKAGGILSVITYHSLEDRLVKNFIRDGKFEGKAEKDIYGNTFTPFKPVANKIIIPDDTEIKENSRSRSAKLRIAERTEFIFKTED